MLVLPELDIADQALADSRIYAVGSDDQIRDMLLVIRKLANRLVSLVVDRRQLVPEVDSIHANRFRSEERRVGKECRSRWSTDHEKKKRRVALIYSIMND